MSKEELVIQVSNAYEELSCISYAIGYIKLPKSRESAMYSGTDSLYNTSKRKEIFTYVGQKCIGMSFGDGFGNKEIYPKCVKKIEDKYRPKK